MAGKGKKKKVESRDIVRNMLAQLIMEAEGTERISRTKEGLLVTLGEQDLIVRVIQKKSKVESKDIVETITLESLTVEAVEETGETAEEVEAEEVAGE